MFESGLRTTSYANRVAQGGFFCAWNPVFTYHSRYINSLKANQLQRTSTNR